MKRRTTKLGFGLSTVDALFREKITEAINNRKSIDVCLEKGFDTVNLVRSNLRRQSLKYIPLEQRRTTRY